MSTQRKSVTAANGVATQRLLVDSGMVDLTLYPVGTATLQYTISSYDEVMAGTATWTDVPAGWIGADTFLRATGFTVTAFRAMSGAAASGFTAIWKN